MEAESSKTDWIFMGSPGFGARLHVSCVVLHTTSHDSKCYYICVTTKAISVQDCPVTLQPAIKGPAVSVHFHK